MGTYIGIYFAFNLAVWISMLIFGGELGRDTFGDPPGFIAAMLFGLPALIISAIVALVVFIWPTKPKAKKKRKPAKPRAPKPKPEPETIKHDLLL